MEWLTKTKIPIGIWARDGVSWLTDNAGLIFGWLSLVLEIVVGGLLWCLQTPPPLFFVVLACALAWKVKRKAGFCLFVTFALLLIINQGYWTETTQTLSLIIASSITCMLLGVPVGIYSAHHPRFSTFMRPVLDMMQTIPTFVYLIPALILFGLGTAPGLIATVVFALPASIRQTELGVKSTPRSLMEAGKSFGATSYQLLWKVELPHASPNIMAGLTQTIMLSLSMVVISALVGADGLGVPTLRALNTVNIAMGFETGITIVLIAIILDRFLRNEKKAV